MALKLEDFCSENDLDDTIEGVKRRREEKKVFVMHCNVSYSLGGAI